MKSFLLVFLSLWFTSASLQAEVEFQDYPRFVEECYPVALEKLQQQAEFHGTTLDEETVKVDYVDSRWWNPSKYVWFSGVITLESGADLELKAMAQKSFFPSRDCY